MPSRPRDAFPDHQVLERTDEPAGVPGCAPHPGRAEHGVTESAEEPAAGAGFERSPVGSIVG
jgi:hypothetical protein